MLKPIVILTCIISVFVNVETVFAQTKITDDEKVIFAYLKLTEQKPDFDSWIKNSKQYLEASRFLHEKILKDEKARLDWGFGTYDYTKDFITIKKKIRLTTNVREGNKRYIYTRFVDDKHNENFYFTYKYGTESIAFIIQNLDNYQAIELKPEEIPKIKDYFYDSAPYEAEIEMRIKPISADSEKKLFIDHMEQWLMLGEIAYLKINYYDEFKLQDVIVWDYNAPWYLDESQKALLELFKETKDN